MISTSRLRLSLQHILVFLLLLLFISQNRSAALPVQDHSLNSREVGDSDSCDSDGRSLLDIVRGCLATMFLCGWVSIHQNVPPPGQSWLVLVWRRIRMMIINFIAPEIMIIFAAKQHSRARRLSKEFGFSRTHGFFVSMGGFVSQGHHPIATFKQLRDVPAYVAAIRAVEEAELADRSKNDMLSKALTVVQLLWFYVQFMARGLPITLLEVNTVWLTGFSICIWMMWWAKPFDVQRPISIALPVGVEGTEFQTGTDDVAVDLLQSFVGAIDGGYPKYSPAASTAVPSFWTAEVEEVGSTFWTLITLCLLASTFGLLNFFLTAADSPSGVEMAMWRVCSFLTGATPALAAVIFILLRYLRETEARWTIARLIIIPLFPIYIIARLVILSLPFAALRVLPPCAFATVDWFAFFPHI